MYLVIIGFLLICLRIGWQIAEPMAPADFKGLLYIRDYATLLPAALCWYGALLRTRPPSPIDRALSRAEASIRGLRGRPSLVLAISCAAIVLACVAINVLVFKTRAHISDENAYLFQARIFASGRLWTDMPPASPRFFWAAGRAFYQEKWFGGYPPGPSLALMIGVLLRAPFIINPLLSGVLLALTVWAGRRLFSLETGLLAGALMLTSPFALLQGASYFSHVLSAVFFLPAVVLVLTSGPSSRWRLVAAGILAGALLLCRPYSAVLLGGFLILLWVWQVLTKRLRLTGALRAGILVLLGSIPGAFVFLGYNWLLTGEPFRAPLEIAYSPKHTLEAVGLGWHVLKTSAVNLTSLSVMLLGVPLFSLVVPLLSFWSSERRWLGHLVLLAAVYIFGYSLYPFHGLSYGPRYYFELLPFFLIMSACGLRALPSPLSRRLGFARERSVRCAMGICLAGAAISLLGVLPMRLWVYHERAEYFDIRQEVSREVQPPAIVFITKWEFNKLAPELAGYQLNDLDLEGPVIFARDLGPKNPELIAAYPGRHVYTFDLDARRIEPYRP